MSCGKIHELLMILSMTGFGKTEVKYQEKTIEVTIKSLNSKTIDISTRIPAAYRDHDLEIRSMVTSALTRGKIDVTISCDKTSASTASPINAEAVKDYISQIKAISEQNGVSEPKDWWVVISQLNGIQSTAQEQDTAVSDEEWSVAHEAIAGALEGLIQFRTQEGAALQRKFAEKTANIRRLLADVEPLERTRIEKIRHRIEGELAQLKDVEIDRGRLEQEMIYYIEKLDVSEEKQRLANHLKYFDETMDGPAGQGKKLGFIAQEMGREINTLGSKSNLAEMQNIVVKMKDELEQIKEQVLNAL